MLCDTIFMYLVMIGPCVLSCKIKDGFGTMLLVSTNVNVPGFFKLLQCVERIFTIVFVCCCLDAFQSVIKTLT